MSAFPVTVASETHSNRGLVLGMAIHGDTVVAVGGQGSDLVLVSNDGVTWHQGRGKGKGLRGALLRDDGLWVVGERSYFARSEDGGKTWSSINTRTGGCLFGVVADGEGHLWIAGDDGFLAMSKNGTTIPGWRGSPSRSGESRVARSVCSFRRTRRGTSIWRTARP